MNHLQSSFARATALRNAILSGRTFMLMIGITMLLPNLAWTQWSAIANMPGTHEQHGCAATGGFVYVMGGIGPTSVCYKYDETLNTWTTIASMITPVAYPSAAAFNGKIYVTGGYAGCCGGSETTALQVYDPTLNTWATLAPMPAARAAHGSAFVNGRLYVVGGSIGATTFTTLFEYDPVLNSWATKASMSVQRYQLIAAEANGKLYAIGGFNSGVTGANEEYDPSLNTWTTRTALPSARYLHAGGTVLDNGVAKIVIAGGFTNTWQNTSYLYNPTTNNWASNPNMISIRGRVSGAADNNCFYITGGFSGASSLATAEKLCFAAPLPVAFIDFHGQLSPEGALLTWSTTQISTEQPFTIQRSLDGHSFSTIGQVDGNVASDEGDPLTFVDRQVPDAPSGTLFYRIMVVDGDGQVAYSNTIALALGDKTQSARVYPNPVADVLHCDLVGVNDKVLGVQVYDAWGKMQRRQSVSTMAGSPTMSLDVHSLAPGIYFLVLDGSHRLPAIKFVKE